MAGSPRGAGLKILYIAHYCRPMEAAWISTYYLLKALRRTGLVKGAVVLTNDPGAARVVIEDELRGWLKLLRVPFPWALERSWLGKLLRATVGYLLVLLYALRACRTVRITHIFTQHHNYHLASFTGSLLSVLTRRPCIVKVQDGIPFIGRSWPERLLNHYIMRALNTFALRRATIILSKCTERSYLISRVFGVERSKMVLVSNLVDLARFSKVDEAFRDELIRSHGLGDCRLLVFVGNTIGRGLELLVRALPLVARRIRCVRLLLAGPAPDREELEDLARSLGVGDVLVFLGVLEHELVPTVISMADLCIGPLRTSWFSLADVERKVLEYMACGKPFLAARWSVSSNLLSDGETGVAVDRPEDPEELAAKVIQVLEDPGLAQEMGQAARERIKAFYDCGSLIVIERLREVLLRALRRA